MISKRHVLISSTVLAILATIAPASRQTVNASSNTSTSTDVTTIVHDFAADGITQTLMRSDDYNGSGQATYTSSSTHNSSLGSTINSIGEWSLVLEQQSVRTLWITPNDPDGAQPTAPPAGFYYQGTNTSSRCFDQNGNVVPLQNILTSSGNCKLGLNFDSGKTQYKLLMSPFPFSGAGDGTPYCPSGGCPATGVATVTCNAVSNGQCVSWTITPNTAAPNGTVANLYKAGGPKGYTWTYIGQYYNTFRIDVTNP